MNEKNKRTAINIIAQCIAFVVNLGVSFLLTPYITKTLGKDVYGFVGLAYQVTSYISVFTVAFNAMLNIFVATSYHRKEIDKANQFFSSVILADIAISILLLFPLLFISFKMEMFLDVPASSMLDIKILWALVFFNFLLNLAFGPYGTGVFIKNRLDLSAIRGIESNIIKAIILVTCFSIFSPKVWFVGFAALACGVYILVVNYIYHRKLTPEIYMHAKYFRWDALKELLSVGIWNTVNHLTSIFMNGLDLIVSNLLIGALGMGYISYAQTVPTQMAALIGAIKSAFTPQLTKVYAETSDGNIDKFVREVNSSIQICGFLGSIPILVFMVFGTAFYRLWLPTLTEEEIVKINILAIMILIPNMLDVYISPLYNVNSITKKIKIPVLVTFVMGIVNIIVEIGLIKISNLGIYAIEIVTAVLMVGKIFLFTPVYAAKILSVKITTFYAPLIKGICANILCLGVFCLIERGIEIKSWIMLIAVCGICVIIGYFVEFILVLTKNNRNKIIGMLRNKIARNNCNR